MQRPPSVITPEEDGLNGSSRARRAPRRPSSLVSASDMFSPGQPYDAPAGDADACDHAGAVAGTLNELGNMLPKRAALASAQKVAQIAAAEATTTPGQSRGAPHPQLDERRRCGRGESTAVKAVALSHRLSHRLEEVRARAWHMHAYYLAAVACGSVDWRRELTACVDDDDNLRTERRASYREAELSRSLCYSSSRLMGSGSWPDVDWDTG